MKIITSGEASELMNVSKRYINAACARGEIRGAYKDGNHWMLSDDSVISKKAVRKEKRVFNTTGICDPARHYMVSLGQRMMQVKVLVDDGKYFTINRARQYGKTTTLHALFDYLNQDYFVISMDFQMQMSDAKFRNENAFALAFARAFVAASRSNQVSAAPAYVEALKSFTDAYQADLQSFELVELFHEISMFCSAIPRKAVLMIDEIDSATSNQVFIDFLAKLRGYYNNRDRYATFQSVILAGVCDIKNLKKITSG